MKNQTLQGFFTSFLVLKHYLRGLSFVFGFLSTLIFRPAMGFGDLEELKHTGFFLIKNVDLNPQLPKGGQTVNLSVSLEKLPSNQKNNIKKAQFFIHTGEIVRKFPLTIFPPGNKDENYLLKGNFIAEKSEHLVSIFIEDKLGNTTILTSPLKKGLPNPDKFFWKTSFDANDQSSEIPDELDILNLWVGYDAKNIFIGMALNGVIAGGSLKEPVSINCYGINISDEFPIPENRLLVGHTMGFVPFWKKLNKLNTHPHIEFEYPPVDFGPKPGERFINNKRYFLGSTPVKNIGMEIGDTIFIFGLTLANLSISDPVPIPYDMSPTTILQRKVISVIPKEN